jgi:hypothetical protein
MGNRKLSNRCGLGNISLTDIILQKEVYLSPQRTPRILYRFVYSRH